VHLSEDGGRTFRTDGTGTGIHVDHHALWINPEQPDHLVLGNDGGLYFSYDGSRNWQFVDNLPIGQYYDIGVDAREPYWIYGGTQDNGTWGLPSRTTSLLGITNLDVVNIAYGDGFYTAVDPRDHRVIYANSQSGRAYQVDLETREERGIRPVPDDPKEHYRFNWSTPLQISPHDPAVVYYGGNKLFRTTDGGHSWQVVSPDLTRNQDWKKLPIMGPERGTDTLSRDDGVSDFGTITTISESPRQAGLIYVGTDDGNVQVTQDGGKTWRDLTSRFKLPGARWVSRVLASRHAAGAAYVSFDGHQDDDFKPYIFRTTDFGNTWTSVASAIPDGMVVNALAEHPRNARLLFAGTEFGLLVSTTGGERWIAAPGNLPRVPVDDIVIEERTNDLVLGTHGRSIIILDDVTAFEELDAALQADAHLFSIPEATQYYEKRALPVPGAAKFSGRNPLPGALLTYYLRASVPAKDPAAAPAVTLRVTDAAGATVRELRGEGAQGIHRVAWDLRRALPDGPPDTTDGWFGPLKGPFVPPGEYTVTLVAGTREVSRKVRVKVDPAARAETGALTARHAAGLALNDLLRAFDEAAKAAQDVDTAMQGVKAWIDAQAPAPAAVRDAHAAVVKKFEAPRERLTPGGFGGPRFQITDLAGQVQASTRTPTEAQVRRIAQLKAELSDRIRELNAVIETDLPALQAQVRAAGSTPAALRAVKPPSQ
jgi:photosystem II stability/assembly factor-like uncharacterized protein